MINLLFSKTRVTNKTLLIFIFTALHLSVFAQQKDSMYNTEMKLPGVKMITVFGKYKVWTRKVGDGKIKILLLHGDHMLMLDSSDDYFP